MSPSQKAYIQAGIPFNSANDTAVPIDPSQTLTSDQITSYAAAFDKSAQVFAINAAADIAVLALVPRPQVLIEDMSYALLKIDSFLKTLNTNWDGGDERISGLRTLGNQAATIRANASAQIAALG